MKLNPGTWDCDPHATTASFTVSNFAVRTVSGTIDVRTASVVVDESGRPTRVHAVLDAATFHTGNVRRDADITGRKFLDAEQHPTIEYRGTEVSPADGGWSVSGQLVVGTHAAPVDLLVEAEATEDGALQVRARGTFDRTAAGLRAPSFLIGRAIELDVRARLTCTSRVP